MDTKRGHPLKHVLIVDDEPHVAVLLANALKKLGDEYLFEATQSSTTALEMIRQAKVPYDLVITDYKMPDLSGVDLAQAVRNISPRTQIVVMTAYGTEQLRETVADLGIEGYISKPFSMTQIREIVKQVLERTAYRDVHPSSASAVVDVNVHKHLHTLRVNVGARCVLLLGVSGYPLDFDGITEGMDIASLSALVAANFMAAAEIGRLLGSGSVFKSSYHEGPEYNIYSYDIDGKFLLAVIFGPNSKPGAVWFYTKQAAAEILPLVKELSTPAEFMQDLNTILEEQFDELFDAATPGECRPDRSASSADSSSVQERPSLSEPVPTKVRLLSFEEAVASGLLSGRLAEDSSVKDRG